jgi:hypothetical protein
MKSLNQIRAALMEVAQDTEAHFVQPTEAQHSIGPMRRQDKEEVKEEGGGEEIGPGTQLRTNRGIWCVVDEIDQHDSNYAWCTDEDGGDIHVNLNTADVVRTGPPRHDRKDQDNSMYQEDMDPQKKRKNLEISMDYLHKKIRDEKDFYKKDEYKDALRRFQRTYDALDEASDSEQPMLYTSSIKVPPTKNESHMTNRTTRNRSHTDPLAGIEDYIKDYRESEDPRFEGKSKAERIKMAVSDFYKANPEKNEGAIVESMDGGHQAEEVSMTRLELDEIADMADDLFHVLPNFDEVPAWVQHKIAAMHAGLHSIYDYYRLKGIERDQCSKGGLEVITIATPQNPVVQPAPVSPAPMD